jgi:peroxiredoxin
MTWQGNHLAPDFVLPDQHGRRFHLSERGSIGATILVFIRGHWCPYCRRYVQKLHDRYSEIVARQAKLVCISPEPPATCAAFAREIQMPFPMLSDSDGVVIDLYHTRNRLITSRTLMPHPAVFVIDRQLQVRFRSIDRNYRRRTTVRTILNAVDEIAASPSDRLPD